MPGLITPLPLPLLAPLLALSTAGDAAANLPFGLDIATLQTSVLLYLGLSSLAFVVVWVVGYLRSR
jgi:NADH:ubiquinone oxidoreductase subunit H